MKKTTLRTLGTLLTTLTMTTSFTSCVYDDLFHKAAQGEHMSLRLNVDWQYFTEEVPTGMTVVIYDSTKTSVHTYLSNDITHVTPTLSPGLYRAIAYNQSVTEFGTIAFRNLEHYDEAMACTEESRSTWYRSRAENRDVLVGQDVEWLAAVGLNPPYQVEPYYNASRGEGGEQDMGTIYPQSVVYTVKAKVRVPKSVNVYSARASITGMAYGCYLASGKRTTATATQLFESWTLEQDEDNPVNGTLTGTVHCFGLPEGFEGNAADNILSLSLLLVDQQTQKDYTFEVGKSWETDPTDPHTLWLNIVLEEGMPDVEPMEGAESGFRVNIDDWGPETVIESPVE